MVTDGGANMVKAVKDGGFVGSWCIASIIHFMVRAGMPWAWEGMGASHSAICNLIKAGR